MAKTTRETVVIGTGYWGSKLTDRVGRHPNLHLFGVCDVRPDASQSILAQRPGVAFYSDPADVCLDERVDAVVIATPFETHTPIASLALSHKKHVLIEKPISQSISDLSLLLKIQRACQAVFMPDFTFLYDALAGEVKKNILFRADTTHIHSERINHGIWIPNCDVIWDLGVHDCYLALSWIGRPTSVSVSEISYRQGVAVACRLVLHYERQEYVAHLAWDDQKKKRTMTIGFASGEPVEADWSSQTLGGVPVVSGEDALTGLLGEFESRIRSGHPVDEWRLYFDTTDLLLAIHAAAEQKQKIELKEWSFDRIH